VAVTGIDELFREYSEPDEFVLQGQMELFAWRRYEAKREAERRRYRIVMSIPDIRRARMSRPKLREYRRNHEQRKRTDQAWLKRRREQKRLSMQRARARAA
jgi:hypothetical protein